MLFECVFWESRVTKEILCIRVKDGTDTFLGMTITVVIFKAFKLDVHQGAVGV